ncbi:hypothetical protein C3F09_09145 [candidate division GN15 bacterium]|uniref:Uncharacterized protein n=1 Tax=candidate division GN15 bacterium TaxID=2072418 RepID=A0A855WY33_9BACT|nr:MAG: hypothetical protein C3F09_09145 [candidate division GN15 bacterium]
MKKLTLAALLALAGLVIAADQNQPPSKEPVSIPEPLQEYYYTGLEPEKLAYCIDLWYDAALKGDKGKSAKYEQMIDDILRGDLDSTRQALSLFARQLDQRQQAEIALDSTILNDKFSPEVIEAQELYGREWDSYKAKAKIAGTIQSSASFSNKYRLMSDYIEVLRRDVGLPKLKYAAIQLKSAQGTVPGEKTKPLSK